MNIIRFRERLKRMQYAGIITEGQWRAVDAAPVFQCGTLDPLNDQEIEFAKQEILDENGKSFKRSPFRLFSILMKAADIEMEDVSVIVSTDSFKERLLENESGNDTEIYGDFAMKLIFSASLDGLDVTFVIRYKSNSSSKNSIAITPYRNWKVYTPKDMAESKRETMTNIAANTRGAALRLVFDMMNPGNAVLRVEPKQHGKSIYWHRARTHYCIINKSQAQKCRLGGRGPTDHELMRAAHWRRAHMRRLMSDKFKHKKGQLVFIKQSWVGPTEWVGTDKKIYKVVNISP